MQLWNERLTASILYTSVTLHSHNQKTYQHRCNPYPMTHVTCIQPIHENREMIWVFWVTQTEFSDPALTIPSHNQETNNFSLSLRLHHAIKRLTTSMSYPSLTLHSHNQKTKNIDVVTHQSYCMHKMKWQKSLIPWHYLSLRLDRTIKRLSASTSHPSFTQSKD